MPLCVNYLSASSCLFGCVSVYLSVCLPLRLPACLPACLSVCLSVCLAVCLSVSRRQCTRLRVRRTGWCCSRQFLPQLSWPEKNGDAHNSSFCFLVACFTSLQHASASRGRICSDDFFMCCHIEIEVADQTFYLTQIR